MLSEADTRAKLIDPAIHQRGWTEDLIRREETRGPLDVPRTLMRQVFLGQFDCIFC